MWVHNEQNEQTKRPSGYDWLDEIQTGTEQPQAEPLASRWHRKKGLFSHIGTPIKIDRLHCGWAVVQFACAVTVISHNLTCIPSP